MSSLLLAIQDRFEYVQPDQTGADFFLPPNYANFGSQVDTPFWFITWVCVFFFILVLVLLVWFSWRYSRTRGAVPDHNAPTHHTMLEITWSGIPLILVIAIFFVGFKGYMDMSVAPKNAYTVDVTAQKWSWSFSYPNGAVTDQLHVPPDEPVELIAKSQDVLHAMFIPDFRVKQDVVPGKYSSIWFIAENRSGKPETHHFFCAEFCGTDHSQMITLVVVHPTRESFDQWATEAAEIHKRMKPIVAGDFLYRTRGCKGCHNINSTVLTGPPLDLAWKELEAGQRTFDDGPPLDGTDSTAIRNYLRESLLNSQARIVAGFPTSMPTYKSQFSDEDIDAVVAFIKWMGENDGKPMPYDTFLEEQAAAANEGG